MNSRWNRRATVRFVLYVTTLFECTPLDATAARKRGESEDQKPTAHAALVSSALGPVN